MNDVHRVGSPGGHIPESGEPGVGSGICLGTRQAYQQHGRLGAGGRSIEIIITVGRALNQSQGGQCIRRPKGLALQRPGQGHAAQHQGADAQKRNHSALHGGSSIEKSILIVAPAAMADKGMGAGQSLGKLVYYIL